MKSGTTPASTRRPFSWAQCVAKFERIAAPHTSDRQRRHVIQAVENLEEITVADLTTDARQIRPRLSKGGDNQWQTQDNTINVGDNERKASVIAGSALALYGLSRRSLGRGAAGGVRRRPRVPGRDRPLRGLRGAWAKTRRSRKTRPAPPQKPGANGIQVREVVTINKSPEELYSFWRNFDNLPKFMNHLESVTTSDDKHSHWVAKAPLGRTVSWDATIINEDAEPPDRLAVGAGDGHLQRRVGALRAGDGRARHRGPHQPGLQSAGGRGRRDGRQVVRRGAADAGRRGPAPVQELDGDGRDADRRGPARRRHGRRRAWRRTRSRRRTRRRAASPGASADSPDLGEGGEPQRDG